MKHLDILAENIKAYRKKLNLKQNELAEKLNISRQVLSSYETGKAEPNLKLLIKLSNLMNCSIDSLLGLDENFILKFPFDNNSTDNLFKSIDSNNKSSNSYELYELIKSLKNILKKNQSTYSELAMSKKRFDIMFNELNRTFNREERFEELFKKLDAISKNISCCENSKVSDKNDSLHLDNNTTSSDYNEEFSDELVPKINFNNSNYIDTTEEETVNVHFLNTDIAAGEPIGYSDIDSKSFKKLKVRYPLTKENADEFYILTVQGNSMNEIVDDGDDILVRSTKYVENGTIAVVNILDERECTLKYYYYDPIKRLITLKPKSYDPNYKDMVFDADEHNIVVQGEYIGSISDFL